MSRFVPKLVVCFREGYSSSRFLGDLGAGLTVAVIALPLAMALGIASIPASVADGLRAEQVWLSPPAMGLYTAIIAGALIAALGGSRVQIGGPTAAFVPIVFGIALAHGYVGLALATLMAGVILVLMGVFRLGAVIKFIPYPVTTGFTAGIAVTLVVSQLKDLLGLDLVDAEGKVVPLAAEFVPKLQVLAEHAGSADWRSACVGAGTLGVLLLLRRVAPRVPGAIVAVGLGAMAVWMLGWDAASGGTVDTIGSRFGGIPRSLPSPHLPHVNWALIRELFPAATTIAVLAAIESLLSAVVADGMTGYRHKSDCELVAQGVANIGSSLFFGIPATGAIARTVANIKSGGTTPVAGLVHAAVLLLFMLLLAAPARHIPLASLSAVLVLVAWNISEVGHFRALLRAPKSDVLVLLTTFGLTVLTDLTVAVAVGMVLASMLFMKRMADVSGFGTINEDLANGKDEAEHEGLQAEAREHRLIPPGVEVFEINGPFFFGVADRLKDTLGQFERPPRVFILRLRRVPAIDATGMHALDEFRGKCARSGTRLLLSGLHAQPLFAMTQAGLLGRFGEENLFGGIDAALAEARRHTDAPRG